jgi:peptide/nickel transport system ATP-binding protein
VGRLVAEPLRNFLALDRAGLQARVAELLDQVGLPPQTAGAFPHQLSGGQCQRVAIARALAPGPEVLICDEPVAALDLPQQYRIMTLLKQLRDSAGLTLLLITHDLGLTWHFCNRLAVMQQGRIIARGRPRQLLLDRSQPHLRRLVESTPRLAWPG